MQQVESKIRTMALEIPAGGTRLGGDIVLPEHPAGLILFAHGSGSSRFSPRNRHVAGILNKAGFATLLMDLLGPDEEEIDRDTGMYRFDVDLLAGRVAAASLFVAGLRDLPSMKLGFFGASTGAAAALIAAARLPGRVSAVVSRGGRPDLARQELLRVQAPTLLIVGGRDDTVLEWNREALEMLDCEKKMEIVPGATHLFEEPGAMMAVTRLAADWFSRYLGS
jgi:putative phosphoribosyl transferase